MTFRKTLLFLHLAGGLLSALTLILLGASGGLLVFEGEIDHWLNRKFFRVETSGARRSLSELRSSTEQRHAGSKVSTIILPIEDSVALTMSLRFPARSEGFLVTVNPYTGEELGSLNEANQFLRKLHQFHTNLLLGPAGKTITACSAFLLLGLAASGLVLWWPRKILGPGRGSAGGRMNFELHNFLGFYSSIFMLLFAITGIVIHWDNEVKEFINRWSGIAEEAPVASSNSPSGNVPTLNADQLFAVARNAVPGARVTSLQGLSGGGPIRVTMRYPEDRTPLGRTNLYISPPTGELLSMQTSRTGPIGMRIAKLWNREIHTGDIGGLPTRILACAASFALPLLAITGPLIWFGRMRRRRHGEFR